MLAILLNWMSRMWCHVCILAQLANTKAQNGKQTMMHFLVDCIEKRFPDVMHFASELLHLEKSAGGQWLCWAMLTFNTTLRSHNLCSSACCRVLWCSRLGNSKGIWPVASSAASISKTLLSDLTWSNRGKMVHLNRNTSLKWKLF